MAHEIVNLIRDHIEGKAEALPILADYLEERGDERAADVREGRFDFSKFAAETIVIWDQEYKAACQAAFRKASTPQVGKWVEPDGWRGGNALVADESGFTDFRLPSHRYTNLAYAVRIHVTGRTLRRGTYKQRVRVNVEFVGDGEPSKFHRGWMYVD